MRTADASKACQVADGIPGWLEPEVAEYLYEIGYNCAGDIVEVGTYFGKSTYLIAQGMKDGSRLGKLITVDVHWRGIDEQTRRPLVLAEDSMLALCRTLKQHALEDLVIQMIGWSHDCLARLDFNRVDTVFVDGGHDYESCSGDFLAIKARLRLNLSTRLLFHDYGPDFPGVQETIRRFVIPGSDFKFHRQIGTLYVCDSTTGDSVEKV